MPVNWKGAQFEARFEAAIKQKLDVAAELVRSSAVESMSWPKTGVFYPRLVTRSSAPGEPPAIQFAKLSGSVTWERRGTRTRRIGTNVVYGRYLEIGTSRMKARPWLYPALKRSLVQIRQMFAGRIM